jgi:hypothetical protein
VGSNQPEVKFWPKVEVLLFTVLVKYFAVGGATQREGAHARSLHRLGTGNNDYVTAACPRCIEKWRQHPVGTDELPTAGVALATSQHDLRVR